jgi:hypothetical protein
MSASPARAREIYIAASLCRMTQRETETRSAVPSDEIEAHNSITSVDDVFQLLQNSSIDKLAAIHGNGQKGKKKKSKVVSPGSGRRDGSAVFHSFFLLPPR